MNAITAFAVVWFPCALGAASQEEMRVFIADRLPQLLAPVRDTATQQAWYAAAEAQKDSDLRSLAQALVIWDQHIAIMRDTRWGTEVRRVGDTTSPAIRLLEQSFPKAAPLNHAAILLQAHILGLRAVVDQDLKARERLEGLGSDAGPTDRSAIAVVLAMVALCERDHVKAKAWLDQAEAFQRASGSVEDPDAMRRLGELRTRIEDLARQDVYGPVWQGLREAQMLASFGSFSEACAALQRTLSLAARSPALAEPILIAAINIELLRITARMDTIDQFTRTVAQTKEADYGPWWGEALVLRGDERLDANRPGEAALLYAAAWTWFERGAFAHLALPERLTQIATPAPEWRRNLRSMGRAVNFPEPGHIFGPTTSPWYVPYWQVGIAARQSLCAFLANNIDEASQFAARIGQFDPEDREQTRKGMPSSQRRLIDGYRTGGLYASNEELAAVPTASRAEFLRCELLFQIELYGPAMEAYRRFLRRHPDMPDDVKAYVTIPVSLALHWHSQDDKASEQVLWDAIAAYPKSRSLPRLLMEVSDATTDWGKKMAALERIGQIAPQSIYRFKADCVRGTAIWLAGDKAKGLAIMQEALKVAKAINPEAVNEIEAEIRSQLNYERLSEHPNIPKTLEKGTEP